MSPILIRPVREQLEHDRVIRLLQAKWSKRYEAAANPGDERNAPLKIKGVTLYPDLLLSIADNGKKAQGVVEVETAESLNHLEAMAQWTHFSKSRGYFYLYVPAAAVDVAKRLVEQHAVSIAELWSYYQLGDQVRFLQVSKTAGTPELSMADEEEAPARAQKRAAEVAAAAPVAKELEAPATTPVVASKRSKKKVTARATRAGKGAGSPSGAKRAASKKAPASAGRTKMASGKASRSASRSSGSAKTPSSKTSRKSAAKGATKPAKVARSAKTTRAAAPTKRKKGQTPSKKSRAKSARSRPRSRR